MLEKSKTGETRFFARVTRFLTNTLTGKNVKEEPIESENVSKERAAEIFERLLLLSSVEILQVIQNISYLSASEVYSKEELEKIRA